MHIEDIYRYITKNNIAKKSREPYYIDNRMYIYAILYHIHKWSLSRIGKLFNTHHSTVLHALRIADARQSDELFIENCKELQEQFFFIIPQYNVHSVNKEEKKTTEYIIKLKVNKEQYYKYLQTKNVYDIYDMLWDLSVQQAKKIKR